MHVDDNEERVGRVSFEQLVDLEIACAQLGARVIPADQLLARVDLLEHIVHSLDVVVVNEPHRRVLLIFLKRNWLYVSDLKLDIVLSLEGIRTREAV